jgi:LysR family transcriptional activator of mexEF-oprN operon
MHENYGRDLDLNLLRVFAVVAETGSVTQAATSLYLTQPAVSAALRRLSTAVGADLFARQGRRLALTERGRALRTRVQAHLPPLVEAALSPPEFDPKTSERTLRIGMSDAAEVWLLAKLLAVLEREAPRMRVTAIPVQFRTVPEALSSGSVELAITVADELPAGIRREQLFWGDFVCLFEGKRGQRRARMSEKEYFAREHVIVSYNGDLRGLIEDLFGKQRTVRCSVSSFSNLGAIVSGTRLVATVPRLVAHSICAIRPRLVTAELPFEVAGTPMELLWPAVAEDDAASRFVRELVTKLSREAARNARAKGASGARA